MECPVFYGPRFKKHLKSYLFQLSFSSPACRACDYVYIHYLFQLSFSSPACRACDYVYIHYLFQLSFSSPACRACDYVYIDYVRRSRSSSCRLLRPINCQTYITLHYVYIHVNSF